MRADTRGGRTLAIRLGLIVLAVEFSGTGLPATVDVASEVLPTYSPEGSSPLFFSPPEPVPSSFPFPAEAPGAPEAPRWPSGVAAKLPRRLPAGGSGGAPTAGWRLNAITP